MIELASIGSSVLATSGRRLYAVEAPYEMARDHPPLIGMTILLDGKLCKVQSVGRNLPLFPIRKGEHIELLVDWIEEGKP